MTPAVGVQRERRTALPRSTVIALAGALIIGLNLRPAMTSVAVLLDEIAVHWSLGGFQVVLLSALPVAAFGITAPLVPRVVERLGIERTLLMAMVVLALALWLRPLIPGMLLPGTFLAGMAIMFGSVLLPSYLGRLGVGPGWVGIVTTTFMAGAALGAFAGRPLNDLVDDLPTALGLWALPVVVAAAVAWGPAMRAHRERRSTAPGSATAAASAASVADRSRGRAAVVTLYTLQAVLFASVTAWLPLMLGARGVQIDLAGSLLAWVSVIGFAPPIIIGILARKRARLRVAGPVTGVVAAVSLLQLATMPDELAWLWVSLLGASQSAAFAIAMVVLVRRAGGGAGAARLSALSQGIGFILGAAASALVGLLRTATGDWGWSLAVLAVAALAFAAVSAVTFRPVDGARTAG